MPYLYGASIQGIQGFVFETNVLREMIGASELIEQICTDSFDDFVEKFNFEIIMQAAGNIRLVAMDKECLEILVCKWPKHATEQAVGITISQAVVQYDGSLTKKVMNTLEEKLKAQRNLITRPVYPALMAMERCRRTGKPAVDRKNKKTESGLRDLAMVKKQAAGAKNAPRRLMEKLIPEGADSSPDRIPFDLADITKDSTSGWLAVIHADGNSLGKLIQGMSAQLGEAAGDQIKMAYKDFSVALDRATCMAAQEAFGSVILDPKTGLGGTGKRWKYPLRPVVLGGDDLTVICRADVAIEFTRKFLEAFQQRTAETLAPLVRRFKLDQFKNGLTACAGICFVKQTYPFHYAIHLAENLCAFAKKDAKSINELNVPACLAFHKVQSSFVEDYQVIVKRELTGTTGVKMACGPYYLEDQDGKRTIERVLEQARMLLKSDAPKSGIRKLLTLLCNDRGAAEQWMKRLHQIHDRDYKTDLCEAWDEKTDMCPAYDWMTVASMKGGE